MDRFFSVFSLIYSFFSRHRVLLYAMTFTVIVAAALILSNIRMNEDIAPLLPDGQSEAARDFALLRKAPFAGKVLINLQTGPAASKKDLIDTADRLAQAMSPPYFTQAVTGPTLPSSEKLPAWLMNAIPDTFTSRDQMTVEKMLTSDAVRDRLKEVYRQLASPEGLLLKPLLQADPLDLRSLVLEKLKYVNIVPGMRLYNNHFISGDEKNTLIIAETPVNVTDSRGSREMLDHLRTLIKKVVPAPIEASIMSAHAYTIANAETIKNDLVVILGCSSVVIFFLILAFLRSWKGILVFLVPSSVLCLATAGTLLIYDSVSAVTIAFGSVLLGISDDYPILVYFALCSKKRDPRKVISEVARPVLFGGITTIVTFSVMLLSNLPGQRQLAVFTMIGVAVALGFSLLTLPHLLHSLPGEKRYIGAESPRFFALPRRWVIICWLVISLACVWQGTRLHFSGSLQSFNVVLKDLQQAELRFSKIWGDFRDNAILFSEGKDLQSSLQVNDRLFLYLADRVPQKQIISLAPIFPSEATQRANAKRWKDFWEKGGEARASGLLRAEGGRLGFSPAAFSPFFEILGKAPQPVRPEDLSSIGFSELMRAMIVRDAHSVLTLTLVPDTGEIVELFDKDVNKPKGVRLVSQNRFSAIISKALVDNFVNYIFLALLVIVISVSLLFRNLKNIVLSLVPVATGLIVMVGIMGFLDIRFNLFNIVATILVIGLGVDLGIFMVCNLSEGYEHTASLGILLGGLTSFVGLGALALARHPALSSIGITVMLGLCGVIPSALFVIPALYGARRAPASP